MTKLYGFALTIPSVRYFEQIERLHAEYGDYVRLGPRELSIADVEAVPLVHGISSKCTKGPWYDAAMHIEGSSLHNTRSKAAHKDKRRAWDRALNAKSLRAYESRIEEHVQALVRQLNKRKGQAVRINNWVNYFSFDAIGDIAFSQSFGMVENGQETEIIQRLHASHSSHWGC